MPKCLSFPLLCGLACAALAAAASPQDAAGELPPAVRQALVQAGVGPDALAAVALPLQHAAPPWQHRASVPMQPASTMKIVTSIVALDRLGPNHRGSTELRSSAPLSAGVLMGDLVLKGGADPDLGVPQLWALLLDLRQAGVETIQGDVLVDRSLFSPARMDLGLAPFDESPEFAYNVIPDAVHLAGHLLPLELKSDTTRVTASTVPHLPAIVIDAAAMTIKADRACSDWDDDWKPAVIERSEGGTPGPASAAGGEAKTALVRPVTHIRLQGAYPPNCTQRTGLQLVDRLELEDQLFRALWRGLGGRWNGAARELTHEPHKGGGPDQGRVLARRTSRPWGEVLRTMNKSSDNALTRLLYLQLGVPGGGDTRQAADRQVRGWLAQHHIDATGLVLDNGSGLSRSERITPLQLASMLKVAHAGSHAADLAMSLPTVGVDGTMRNRLKHSPASGWARMKTGTLRNVVALAGYVNDAQGRPWAVAMMINHERALRARPALDALVDHVARVGFTPARQIGPLAEGP
ncbi:MAG TPA: D-alanyl-D-alanine carboxypeptidase/D-alanyl-D-alanine-endopeptidase [Rubrivivax sp.]|nr:D-alanyl-D-alanine carboxypeptidase/D-alanyl-D-alanine-endopeptidase [Rubrivivax sp.]